MKIAIYIDSCAWNYLHQKQIDLAKELPANRYKLFITREIEIELAAIPEQRGNTDNRALKNYIRDSIARLSIATSANFGFRSCRPDGTPSATQVYAGFGQGTFQSAEDRHYYNRPEVKGMLNRKLRKKTGLRGNQADASLAVRATRAIILTDEKPSTPGPLRLAAEVGGRVLYLSACLERTGLTLDEYFVSSELAF